ncbi:MAG: P1 family peptidase [Lewinellaceae bacterium]|nr:P1 family peptidase [Lewinellaceae bacterium]
MRTKLLLLFILLLTIQSAMAQSKKLRDIGIRPGVLYPGPLNAITDVSGVRVGHTTLILGDSIRTGVTAILLHEDNIFQEKVPAAIYIGNGFGKLAGYSQVEELGNIETPIVLTNTLSVPVACEALIDYTLAQPGNEAVRSVNPVVGETNDGGLNDIRGRHVRKEHVLQAIEQAASGPVLEGNVGAGTGTICFGFKGGIGTASRRLPAKLSGYTVGVLVQTNFGGVLQIDGLQVGEALGQYYLSETLKDTGDGSCMIIVATDAPADARNLKRMAKRAVLGLARTGGIASNGSGDYVIAFSTARGLRVPYQNDSPVLRQEVLDNNAMSPLFLATIEATEEAILNSLFAAETMAGNGRTIEALPLDKVMELMKRKGEDDKKE